MQEKMLFSWTIYTAGTNFTRPPVVTVATNLNSDFTWFPKIASQRFFRCLLKLPAWADVKSHWLHLTDVAGFFFVAELLKVLEDVPIFWQILDWYFELRTWGNKLTTLKICLNNCWNVAMVAMSYSFWATLSYLKPVMYLIKFIRVKINLF